VSSPTACRLCRGPLGPDEPRRLAFAQTGLSAQVDCCSSCRTRGYGSAGVAANQSRAAG
jgi:hypothetical protein